MVSWWDGGGDGEVRAGVMVARDAMRSADVIGGDDPSGPDRPLSSIYT